MTQKVNNFRFKSPIDLKANNKMLGIKPLTIEVIQDHLKMLI